MRLNTINTLMLSVLSCGLFFNYAQANNSTVDILLEKYQTQGAQSPDMEQGKVLWQKTFKHKSRPVARSCASCHTKDLKAPGKHIKTNRAIKAMSPEVNPERLSDTKKIEKWFKRNCKWTMSRECSVQEKADFLVYINNTMNF